MKPKKTKSPYRLRNWKGDNASLVQRGSLTIWVSEEVIEGSTAWLLGAADVAETPHRRFDPATRELVAAVVTTNDLADSEGLPDVFDQAEGRVDQVPASLIYVTKPLESARRNGSASLRLASLPTRGSRRYLNQASQEAHGGRASRTCC